MTTSTYCPHRKDHNRDNCMLCGPDATRGREIAHGQAEILARFSMNLPRVKLAKPDQD